MVNRLGESKENNGGSMMSIIRYHNGNDIDVEFKNGCIIKNRTYKEFRLGTIKNPYERRTAGIGYLGQGEYKSIDVINGKECNVCDLWENMLQRCYSDKYQKIHPTYIGCTVADEWHNFQNYAKWFHKNYYIIEGQRMELDKDILMKGNKIYSPEICVFVPKDINLLFIKCNKARGDYPIGVDYHKKTCKYRATCQDINRKQKHLGLFSNIEDAFYCYKDFKENIIKELADKYKEKIPQKLYNAMYKYEVEITD